MNRQQMEDLRSAAGCLGLLILLAILLALAGCAHCEPQIVDRPVEVKVPYPVVVVPTLPGAPQCEQPVTCPSQPPEVAQCVASNVTKMETCIGLWNNWYVSVVDVLGGLEP